MKTTVVNKSVCKCGAITLTFDNGAINSMLLSTYNNLPPQYHAQDQKQCFKVYCCNHCVNHWGIDIDPSEGELQVLEECMPLMFNSMGNSTQYGTLHANTDTIEDFENGYFDNWVREQSEK